jgi:hypothetical protein
MGNKDARRAEKKKPKREKPKEVNPPPVRIIREAPKS